MRALLRLVRNQEQPDADQPLTCGPLQLWPAQHRVTLHGNELDLTPKEYELLAYFMQNEGRALGRETLLRHVWGYDQPVDSRTVDTHIRRLRAKIETDPVQPQLLQTIRGFGYRLEEQRL